MRQSLRTVVSMCVFLRLLSWYWNLHPPQLWLVNQQGKSIHFIFHFCGPSLAPSATLAESCQPICAWEIERMASFLLLLELKRYLVWQLYAVKRLSSSAEQTDLTSASLLKGMKPDSRSQATHPAPFFSFSVKVILTWANFAREKPGGACPAAGWSGRCSPAAAPAVSLAAKLV